MTGITNPIAAVRFLDSFGVVDDARRSLKSEPSAPVDLTQSATTSGDDIANLDRVTPADRPGQPGVWVVGEAHGHHMQRAVRPVGRKEADMKLGEKRQCVRMKSVEILSESHRNKLRAHALAAAVNRRGDCSAQMDGLRARLRMNGFAALKHADEHHDLRRPRFGPLHVADAEQDGPPILAG